MRRLRATRSVAKEFVRTTPASATTAVSRAVGQRATHLDAPQPRTLHGSTARVRFALFDDEPNDASTSRSEFGCGVSLRRPTRVAVTPHKSRIERAPSRIRERNRLTNSSRRSTRHEFVSAAVLDAEHPRDHANRSRRVECEHVVQTRARPCASSPRQRSYARVRVESPRVRAIDVRDRPSHRTSAMRRLRPTSQLEGPEPRSSKARPADARSRATKQAGPSQRRESPLSRRGLREANQAHRSGAAQAKKTGVASFEARPARGELGAPRRGSAGQKNRSRLFRGAACARRTRRTEAWQRRPKKTGVASFEARPARGEPVAPRRGSAGQKKPESPLSRRLRAGHGRWQVRPDGQRVGRDRAGDPEALAGELSEPPGGAGVKPNFLVVVRSSTAWQGAGDRLKGSPLVQFRKAAFAREDRRARSEVSKRLVAERIPVVRASTSAPQS